MWVLGLQNFYKLSWSGYSCVMMIWWLSASMVSFFFSSWVKQWAITFWCLLLLSLFLIVNCCTLFWVSGWTRDHLKGFGATRGLFWNSRPLQKQSNGWDYSWRSPFFVQTKWYQKQTLSAYFLFTIQAKSRIYICGVSVSRISTELILCNVYEKWLPRLNLLIWLTKSWFMVS